MDSSLVFKQILHASHFILSFIYLLNTKRYPHKQYI